nr:hypothetical protein [uncultured Chryseobacterium sp.]
MQEEVRKEFIPLESKPWWLMTWLIRIFAPVFLLVIFLLFLVFPFLLTSHKIIFLIIALLYYPTLLYGTYRIFRNAQKSRQQTVIKILVDDKGLHYYKKDGSVDEFLYSELGKWNLTDVYDVGLSYRVKTWILQIRYEGSGVDVDFNKMDPGFSYFVRNTKALRRKFIQGIAYFRPDVTINPSVFDVFYINPRNFEFDIKKYWKMTLSTIAMLIVGGAILGLIMLGFVKWLFKKKKK